MNGLLLIAGYSFSIPFFYGKTFSSGKSMAAGSKTKEKLSIKVFLQLFRNALLKLIHNDPLRMAGATAFFTTFALPAILIILIQLLRLIYDPAKIRSELSDTLAETLGKGTMQQVTQVLTSLRHMASNWWITALGLLFLLLVASTLLMVIKKSINQLWRIKVIQRQTVGQRLKSRLQSLLIILGTGILFFLSILTEGLKAYLDRGIHNLSPSFAFYFVGFINYMFSVVFVTLWFTILFRLLPDAKAPWRVAVAGAFVTSLLFNLGKYLLRVLLVNSNLNSLYGASASIVFLLLFVFYSSLIMYFGVAFTHIWAEYKHFSIRPRPHASRYRLTEVEGEENA